MDRRVHVVQGPFVGRQLAVGVHVPLAEQQDELALGPVWVDQGHRDHMESEIPGCVPGIFPLVGHRQHVQIVEMRPVGVAPLLA